MNTDLDRRIALIARVNSMTPSQLPPSDCGDIAKLAWIEQHKLHPDLEQLCYWFDDVAQLARDMREYYAMRKVQA